MVQLTGPAQAELRWWADNVTKGSKHISHGKPTVCLNTDASKAGWGAVRDGEKTGGRWTASEAEDHINHLELKAVLFGLHSLCTDVTDTHIKVLVDNSTAVCYINEQGGTVSDVCDRIPGLLNVEADEASRKFNDRTEWELHRDTFEALCERVGRPDIDLFASRLNNKLESYVSWKPDPYACYIDAFTVDWTPTYNYLFPPFRLISSCAQKILQEKTTALFIVPLWPSQFWFPQLMEMLTQNPLLLPRACLSPPAQSEATLPSNIRIIARRISGHRSESEAFRKTLPSSSSRAGVQPLGSNINQQLISGQPFVVRGRSLVIHHL